MAEAITTSLDEAALGQSVEDNLHALFLAMASALGGEVDAGPELSRHHCFPSNPMFKGVCRTRLAPDRAEAAIDETLAWFAERDAPYFFWWTAAGTQPDDLGARLQARGLLSMEHQQQVLAADIKQTAAGAPAMGAELAELAARAAPQPAGFVIEPVASARDLDDFKQVFVTSYGIPEWAGQGWVDATMHAGLGRSPWRPYVGRLDGVPVATNMLFNGGGVASVYAVATVPAARGKGLGAAVTLGPLLEARREGFRHAVLFSTEMGLPVYQRMGFRDLGYRINRYLWRR